MLVLGIGNILMMDDGIGIYVIEELRSRCKDFNTKYVIGETDVYYCLAEIEKADYVVIIDAASMGEEPCSVATFILEDILQELSPAFSFHDINILQTMKQHNLQKPGILIAIEICNINFTIGLSPMMEEYFINIVNKVEDIITSIRLSLYNNNLD